MRNYEHTILQPTSTIKEALQIIDAEAISRAMSAGFIEKCWSCINPYGMGNTSIKIVDILERSEVKYQKRFVDL